MDTEGVAALEREVADLRARVSQLASGASRGDELCVDELAIVDAGGAPRLLLSGAVDERGTAGLILLDAAGAERGRLAYRAALVDAEPDAETVLRLGETLELHYRERGNALEIGLEVTETTGGVSRRRLFAGTVNSTAVVELCDAAGAARLRLVVDADGKPHVDYLGT